MSAASVTAYFSPTMARNCSISSGGSNGAAGWTRFIVLGLSHPAELVSADSRSAQPVVDGFAQPVIRNGHHRDRICVSLVERTKVAEKIGSGLGKIALL